MAQENSVIRAKKEQRLLACIFICQANPPQASAAYYNGGCAFIAPEEHRNVTVIARYADLPQEPAAIVQCRVGKGLALLSGVHPEYSAAYEGAQLHLKGHLSWLKEIEEMRHSLFKDLLFSLLHAS